jgi:hypothetical protein
MNNLNLSNQNNRLTIHTKLLIVFRKYYVQKFWLILIHDLNLEFS